MKKRIFTLVLPIITLILEILPYGVILNFGHVSQENEVIFTHQTYSYFSIIPFGYAHFLPLIVAIATCLLILLLIIYCIHHKIQFLIFIKNLFLVVFFLSLFVYLFDFEYFSLIGGMISLTLLGEFIFLQTFVSKIKNVETTDNI